MILSVQEKEVTPMEYESLVFAVAYADAKGLPYETKTKQQIVDLGGVSAGLIAPDTHSGDFRDFAGKPAGTWSDDTQHTLAMMRSLHDDEDFDLVNLAHHIRHEYDISPSGWGGATKKSIARVDSSLTIEQALSIGVDSAGSGPLMRLPPLALYGAFKRGFDLNGAVEDQTRLTHTAPEAVVGSVVLAQVIQGIVDGESSLTEIAIDLARSAEHAYNAQPFLSSRLERSLGADDISGAVYEQDAFAIWSVLTIALSVFDRSKDASLYELVDAVISEGGDTDSAAAIAGALYAIKNPDFVLDDSIVQQLDRAQELRNVGRDFSTLINSLI